MTIRNLLIPIVLLAGLYGCSSHPMQEAELTAMQSCIGSTEIPPDLADQFALAEDDALLQDALGDENEGKLCQGQVYETQSDSQVVIFRAWNSTNPYSKLGNWWAFYEPTGKVADYRADYEICYQWSPLDKLIRCTLKPEIKVVVGTGQSAECSEYLTYPVSDEQQIYLDDASVSVIECAEFDGEFEWRAIDSL
jgi:hypothetical protein